ncbi:T9SS type A sorting domain-containing protein [Flavobacterium amniphilum]|uniref:DUF7619 domain-containing protein n=1 Tax=Flavobacterium amniphilum TaxID=1834035 RepID=UPI002029FD48|nr:leucine-rich repeat domain-containing protein [Flavobacterium amniphilum]MCL9805388.1 T9SS type A sorting domain-containing protein [Flavobacterium amniphilum]
MKKIYFLLLALSLFTTVNAQIINFPDANFKTKLLASAPNNAIAKDLAGNYFNIDANNDGEIQVSEALNVSYLMIRSTRNTNSPISNFSGIEYFTNLTVFICNNNNITSLDISSNVALRELDCSNNQLTSLDLSNNTALLLLYCTTNQLTSLDLSNNIALTDLRCFRNQIATLNLNGVNAIQMIRCNNNNITGLDLSNKSNLIELQASRNQLLSLNVDGCVGLQKLYCDYNLLTSLNANGLINLIQLGCNNNQLRTLEVNGLSNLVSLYCGYNQLVSINGTHLTSLSQLHCYDNQLINLDISNSVNLRSLMCSNNQIQAIDFSRLTSLDDIHCSNNQFTTLDFSNNTNLEYLDCSSNPLQSLFLKNNSNEMYDDFENNIYYPVFNFSNSPNLEYICADEFQVEAIQNKIVEYGYNNCHVNTYCSFTPGGSSYTIQGNSKFDLNSNGCDVSDVSLANLKFNTTSGSTSGSIIANTSGNYAISVQAGTHTITPVLENPAYFTITPSSVDITFPAQASPFTQNFCVTPNGLYPDLEVTVLPLNTARPGFNAAYKLIYRNKGNITNSGSINLTFNDAVLDFVITNPTVATQTINNLSWNFIDLLPFETREIIFILNVNSPMETPPVNAGDILTYTATISSPIADETPNDNTFVLNQTVVNSFDPNDKTCLEGKTIPPSEVGKYVHYMIRFENTGTFLAENIVVKDMIDTNKFDVNTLVPMKGSHSFVTKVSSGNKVEFIFENINLPFDDANNDGYVMFKIKTKPTLVNGDTFSNSASIYFDYNFPIVTNTETTTIQALNNQDFEFANYFKLYPNPVHNVLNMDAKETIEISSVNIYNTLGQLVVVIPNAKDVKTIDVSNLPSGNYFIKINSDKGTSNTKFIKQ